MSCYGYVTLSLTDCNCFVLCPVLLFELMLLRFVLAKLSAQTPLPDSLPSPSQG